MLCLIKGAAKTGKTTELFKRLKEAVSLGRQALLIVPEQASFYNERRIEKELGAHRGLARAMSFSRFAERIAESLGKGERPQAGALAGIFMMSVALDEVSDCLDIYKKQYRTRGFVGQMLSAVEELQNAGVTPERLSEAADRIGEEAARLKLRELALIYDGYAAVLSHSYCGADELMQNAAQKLRQGNALSGTEVFIDDFGGFTAPELELIEAFLSSADRVTVTVCTADGDSPALLLARDTENRLIKAARAAGVKTEEAQFAKSFFASKAMEAMETAQRLELTPKCEENDGAVTALSCADAYEELKETASEIARLASQGMRYRDMAVTVHSLSRYKAALPSVFKDFGIPFFIDEKGDARTALLTNGLLAVLRAACRTRDADWLEIARSPLSGLERDVISELENYCYVWSVKPSEWQRPFDKNPSGMAGTVSESDRELLGRLNAARETVSAPVEKLSSAIKSGSGSRIARGLWQYLQDVNAAGAIKDYAASVGEGLPSHEDAELARRRFLDEQELLWQQLMTFLELFDSLGEDICFTPDRVYELADLCFGSFEVALIPRTLDEVTVGTAQRMRCENAEAVFLMGAVEGEFPATSEPEGLLSAHERKLLAESGLDLLAESDRIRDTESMFCYRAVTAPSRRLFVTCPQHDITGEGLLPSEIFARAQALTLPAEAAPYRRIWSKQGLKEAVAAAHEEKDGDKALLYAAAALLGKEETERLRHCPKPVHVLRDRSAAAALFGSEMSISPSGLERFYKCPFSYFIKNGLHAKSLSRAELSPSNLGTLTHRILERVVTEHGKGLSALSEEELAAQIKAEADLYMAECAGEGGLSARMKGNIELLCGRILEMLKNLAEELKQSDFSPIAFELEIKRGGEVEPMVLTAPQGQRIYVEGAVDRVDAAVIEGKNYVRVIDYKTGQKDFAIDDLYYGLNAQMLIYLFSIVSNARRGKTVPALQNADAAGALYLPARSGYVTAAHGDPDDKTSKAARRQYRMNGLLLDDERVLAAMEQKLEGRFIPYSQGGRAKAESPLYSADELSRLEALVCKRMTDMAQALHDGRIAAVPLFKKDNGPCKYCDFKAACSFEEGDEVRRQHSIGRDEILYPDGKGGAEDAGQNQMDAPTAKRH